LVGFGDFVAEGVGEGLALAHAGDGLLESVPVSGVHFGADHFGEVDGLDGVPLLVSTEALGFEFEVGDVSLGGGEGAGICGDRAGG